MYSVRSTCMTNYQVPSRPELGILIHKEEMDVGAGHMVLRRAPDLVQMYISWFARSPQQQARQTMLCSTAFGTSHINKLQFDSSYASLSNFDRLLLNSSAFCALLGFAIRAPPTSGILAPAWLQSQVWIRTVLLHRSPP